MAVLGVVDALGTADVVPAGDGDGDMLADAGMVADGVAAGAVVGTADADGDVLIETGVRGVLVAVEGIRAGVACPEWATGDSCAEAPRAMPPAADAARNTVITAARASRRRRCRSRSSWGWGWGWPAAGAVNTDSRAAVTVIDASAAGRSMTVGGTGSGWTTPIPARISRAVGRWPGSLARQRSTSPRTSAGT